MVTHANEYQMQHILAHFPNLNSLFSFNPRYGSQVTHFGSGGGITETDSRQRNERIRQIELYRESTHVSPHDRLFP